MRYDGVRTGRCLVLAVVCLTAAPAVAEGEEADCADPQTQMAMNNCAYFGWEAADGDLNLAYGMAIDRARQLDLDTEGMTRRAGGPDTEGVSTEEMLRRAQRAWITYRDAACVAESDLAFGGSMQPLLYWSCAEALTRERTEQLRFFGEMN